MLKPVQASSHTFRKIIEGGFLYVDKTRYLYNLVHPTIGVYFLARPRRFGKSVMVSTLAEIFRGEKELFRGLWIYDSDYTWPVHPVIYLDFSQERVTTAQELQEVITLFTERIAADHQIELVKSNYQRQFLELILALAKQGEVVILVDEYDKPILDNIENPTEALLMRNVLKNFYGIIKAMDRYVRFVFITGISKFSRVGIFSDMNNLDDLTFDQRYAAMLGITEEELRRDFQEHIAALAEQQNISSEELLQQIRNWYNGFCFVEDSPRVYNPFSTLQLFNKQRFANYWFEAGTPTFLIKLIKERDYDIQPFEQLELLDLNFHTYDIDNLELVPLLLQTGYLTIQNFQREAYGGVYTLSYPNYEVKSAFLTHLLSAYNEIEVLLTDSHLRRLLYALQQHDLARFFTILDILFANIDYDLHINQEKYYQTVFYLIFLLLGVHIQAEVKTNRGRIDAVVELADHIFLFEFKLTGSAATALKQIRTHEYYQKYRWRQPLTLVGARFDRAKRKVTEWKSAEEPKGE